MLTILFNQASAEEIAGTVESAQAVNTQDATGSLSFSGTHTETQASSSEAATGTETFTGTVAQDGPSQTEAVSGSETFTGTVSETETVQTEAASGSEIFTGTTSETQSSDAEDALGGEVFWGVVVEDESVQAQAASGALRFTGIVDESSVAQTEDAAGTVPLDLIGDITQLESVQLESAVGEVPVEARAEQQIVGGGSRPRRRIPRPQTPRQQNITGYCFQDATADEQLARGTVGIAPVRGRVEQVAPVDQQEGYAEELFSGDATEAVLAAEAIARGDVDNSLPYQWAREDHEILVLLGILEGDSELCIGAGRPDTA